MLDQIKVKNYLDPLVEYGAVRLTIPENLKPQQKYIVAHRK